MKPSLKIAAHLCIGLAAFSVVFGLHRHDANDQPGAGPETAPPGRTRNVSAERPTAKRSMTAAEYQAAWDAIPARKWGKEERMAHQIKLLKAWAERDLEGALNAAFSETWSRGNYRIAGETFALHSAFSEVFLNRSDDVWKLIQTRKAGALESALLLEAWSTTLVTKDRDLYLSYLRGMSGGDFVKALGAAAGEAGDKQFLTKVLEVVAVQADQGLALDGLNRSLARAAGSAFTRDELLEKLRSSNGGMAGFYTSVMAAKFVTSAAEASAAEVSAEIDSLPEDKRGLFARALLNTGNSNNTDMLRSALDHLVANQQWQLLDKQETTRAVQAMNQDADPIELAHWAAALPPREETTEMFHRGVEPYIRKDREVAWNWIQQMDAGYWRDRALGEYSQVNLHVFNDPEKSSTAIDQIKDPAFREEVKGWRSGWEKQKGK